MTYFIIAAGGTGGHIKPALALAHTMCAQGHRVSWVGAPHGLEHRLVPKAYAMHVVDACPVRGRSLFGLLRAFFVMTRAMVQAFFHLRKQKPNAVLVMGGYVALPVGLAAMMLRIPLFLHEQNAVPGMANRWLRPWATHVFFWDPWMA